MSQHMEALSKANHVYATRADIKRRLKSGELDIREVLNNPPAELENMTIYALIFSLQRWGRARTLKLLRRAQISEWMTIGKMTPRMRDALIDDFSEG